VLIFFIFLFSKIRASPTNVVSSLSSNRCQLSFNRRRHATVSCHASFPLNQDDLASSASSSDNVSSCRLTSWAETEALNSQHRHKPPSVDRPTHTLYCYKKGISILITLPITQSRLYFASSLARASRHRSSTHRHCSLLSLSHTQCSSTQRHLRWWISWLSFAS
jgi:hypothetical protein